MAQNFEDLEIWKKSHDICLEVYSISSKFPKEEIYSLTSQIRRASLSVPTNIAEAHGRMHFLDSVNFLYNARGSLEEVRSLLYVACGLEYISEEERKRLNEEYIILAKRMNAFIRSLRSKKENTS